MLPATAGTVRASSSLRKAYPCPHRLSLAQPIHVCRRISEKLWVQIWVLFRSL
jgi:hypothetical protein